MKVIVVADGDPPLLAPMREAASKAGLSWVAAAPADAAASIADGCVVVGVDTAAGPALEAAAEHGGIRGFVSLDGDLEAHHVELISEWPELALLAVARPGQRSRFGCAVDTYLASAHAASDLIAEDSPAPEQILAWITDRTADDVEVTEVSFTTADGWEIHGTRRVPSRANPVPGVVLLHTGRSDRAVYSRLEHLLTDAGLAVLNIDWRGRGESTNLGTYFELDAETRFAGWRDAAAALDHLASDPRVDAARLAAVGCVHGAEHAVRAAWRDQRVRALVLLTGYRPHEPEEAALLVDGDVDVMYVTAVGQTITSDAMRDLHRQAPRGATVMIEYPGSAIGYQLFEAADGWPISGLLRPPSEAGSELMPAVLAVPGSRHERDAWTHVAMALADRGCTALQIDIRGRGASANGVRYSEMGPAQRRRVSLDVAAAVEELAGATGVDPQRLGLLVEQDTAAEALEAVAGDDRVRAMAVLSARHADRVAAAVTARRVPVYAMASVEDREGLRATVDAYLAAPDAHSRIDVFHGLGVGITMASVLQFERPEERPIEARLADWMAEMLGGGAQPTEPSI